jgi:hypothetical protein
VPITNLEVFKHARNRNKKLTCFIIHLGLCSLQHIINVKYKHNTKKLTLNAAIPINTKEINTRISNRIQNIAQAIKACKL